MKFESFNSFFNSISIGQELLWFMFLVVTFLFAIFSVVLFYHWQRFGRQAWSIALAETVYILGGGFLILGASASIILF